MLGEQENTGEEKEHGTQIVMITGELIVASRLWEGGLGNQLVSLIKQVEVKVVPQQEIEQSRLHKEIRL